MSSFMTLGTPEHRWLRSAALFASCRNPLGAVEWIVHAVRYAKPKSEAPASVLNLRLRHLKTTGRRLGVQ
jgi:hypothetical protein